ncbi:MAG: hypothetical protein KGJ13_11935 [Patescibacteria group bacterium]|nr:hypothetical protein [Patescibacteria group bacterium]
MARKYKTLQTWIEEALSDTEKEAPLAGLSLVYKKPEGGSKVVYDVKIAGKTWDVAKLTDLFTGKAEAFAQDLPGIQRFELQAFYKDRREPESTHNFIVSDGEISQGGRERVVKEDASASGLTAQLMRHLERKDQILTEVVQTFAATSLQQRVNDQNRMDKMQEELNDAYTIVREMVIRETQGQHEMRMKELQFQRDSENSKTMWRLAPALVNGASGKEVFPQATADTALIEGLANYVTPEKLKMLIEMGAIPQEAAAPLLLRLNQIAQQKQAEAAAAKELPPAKNTNGGIS